MQLDISKDQEIGRFRVGLPLGNILGRGSYTKQFEFWTGIKGNLIDKSLNLKVGNKAGKGSFNLHDDNVVRKKCQRVRGMKVPILSTFCSKSICWLIQSGKVLAKNQPLVVASTKLFHWYNKTEDPEELSWNVQYRACGGLAVMAGISGWKYMHHLGKIEDKNTDGEIALCINGFRERKGTVCIRWIMFELKSFREGRKKYCTEVSESLQYPREPGAWIQTGMQISVMSFRKEKKYPQ